MEMYGFARAGVPGEYSPTCVAAALTTDVSNAASYKTLLTKQVTILDQGESLLLVGSIVSETTVSGGTALVRFSVDGVGFESAGKTVSAAGFKANPRRVQVVEGLIPGPHTITLDWQEAETSAINAATLPTRDHAVLLCQRSRAYSAREMDGFPQAGWQMIYTEGFGYSTLTTSNTSTATTPTTSLFTVQAQTRYAASALLIRMSASGLGNNSGAQLSALFQLSVDGVAVVGTGCSEGVAQGFFSANFICVVPVSAGIHNLVVNWAGGAAPGTTINPASTGQHAVLQWEEIFCTDVNFVSDMEGFVTAAFASRNLPRVAYTSLASDFTNGGGVSVLVQKNFYVTGDNSAVLIEFTGSLQSNGVEPIMQILVDGTSIHGTTESESVTSGQVQCLAVEAALNLCEGRHLIQVTMNGITTFSPVTNPTFSHANMVIREIAQLAA